MGAYGEKTGEGFTAFAFESKFFFPHGLKRFLMINSRLIFPVFIFRCNPSYRNFSICIFDCFHLINKVAWKLRQ